MLVRLQGALGSTGLIDQIVLSSKQRLTAGVTTQDINLVVGYNSSPKSQTALDLTLWIAHQTRLATRRQVTVQVVYVIDAADCTRSPLTSNRFEFGDVRAPLFDRRIPLYCSESATTGYAQPQFSRVSSQKTSTSVQDPETLESVNLQFQHREPSLHANLLESDQFEQADRILWQARCLANEWRGSLKTHLRFGRVAQELKQVVQMEDATLLWLGCDAPEHRIVRELGADFPCPVLGTPPALHPDRYFD
ncbi:hypothetical protein BST81_23250 [Leptolyngbya sp. 'hensonii']|nr:hypothetical protein BST81_23250 [Leptolyngbya sp. 'hensonii']